MFACQHQEDALQRKRVAQRTYCVREHTQAFDGGHIRRRLCYVSIIIVITSGQFELPIQVGASARPPATPYPHPLISYCIGIVIINVLACPGCPVECLYLSQHNALDSLRLVQEPSIGRQVRNQNHLIVHRHQ